MLFSSLCVILWDFIRKSPPDSGFYLCQVNWTGVGWGGVGAELLFGDHLGHQASDFPWEDESTSSSHLIQTTLTLLFLLSAPMNWSFYAMLRNFLVIALHLFEAFVWARWGEYHLARQLALFPEKEPLPWGSVTEQQVPFLSCVCPLPVLKLTTGLLWLDHLGFCSNY